MFVMFLLLRPQYVILCVVRDQPKVPVAALSTSQEYLTCCIQIIIMVIHIYTVKIIIIAYVYEEKKTASYISMYVFLRFYFLINKSVI